MIIYFDQSSCAAIETANKRDTKNVTMPSEKACLLIHSAK
jgi:hypothetical protein